MQYQDEKNREAEKLSHFVLEFSGVENALGLAESLHFEVCRLSVMPEEKNLKFTMDQHRELDLQSRWNMLINSIEEQSNQIKDLKAQYGIEARLHGFVYVSIDARHVVPKWALDNRAIQVLAQTGISVEFHVQGHNTLGLLVD